jgi:hypothetical protein
MVKKNQSEVECEASWPWTTDKGQSKEAAEDVSLEDDLLEEPTMPFLPNETHCTGNLKKETLKLIETQYGPGKEVQILNRVSKLESIEDEKKPQEALVNGLFDRVPELGPDDYPDVGSIASTRYEPPKEVVVLKPCRQIKSQDDERLPPQAYKNPCNRAMITMMGEDVEVLIDTGAEASLIPSELAQRFKETGTISRWKGPGFKTDHGRYVTEMAFENKFIMGGAQCMSRWCMAKDVAIPILGADFIKHYQLSCNWELGCQELKKSSQSRLWVHRCT